MFGKHVENLKLLYIVGQYENGAAIIGNSCQFFNKLKILLLYNPGIPLLTIYPKFLKKDLKEVLVHSCW